MALTEEEEFELLDLKRRRGLSQPNEQEVPSFVFGGGMESSTPSGDTDSFDVGKIPESTAYGFVGGLAAPTVIKYGGKGLQMLPFGQPATGTVGRALEVAGEAGEARRLASGASGAVGGGLEESAIQLSKALGAPEPLQYGLGFAAGMFGPSALGATLRNFPLTSQFLREAEAGGFKEAGRRFADRIRGNLPSELREPQERVIARLAEEADRITQSGRQRANQIMGDAEAEIARLAPGAEAQAAQIRQRARDQAAATIFAAKQQAENRAIEIRQIENRARQATERFEARVPEARQAIGQPAEMTDIGNALRQKILSVQGDAIRKRSDDFKTNQQEVVAEVSALEGAGKFVRDRPDFKMLLEELRQRGGVENAVTKTPEMVAATPQLRSFYKQLYMMLSGTGAQQLVGDTASGALKLNFNQIDEVRRLLGDSFTKPVAEGYSSLQQNAERDLYKRLSEILGNYSDKKKTLISTYKEESNGLDIFKTAKGKKATATDSYNDNAFVTDPSQLPRAYFTSRTGVEDLIQLTGGDRALVEQQARAFVSRQLQQARTADQVRGFQNTYSELLGSFPELNRAVSQFADQLTQTTRVTGRIGELQKSLRTEMKALPDTLTEAQRQAGKITKAGEAEAKAVLGAAPGLRTAAGQQAREAQTAAGREARLLTSGQDPVVFFDKLVEEGFTPRFEAAARVIKSDPSLINDFVQGVQISLSRVDPAALPDKYARLVQPALLRAGLITDQQARQIANQVRLIGMTADPSALSIRTANLIKNAIAANAGVLGSRGMEALGLSFTEPLLGGQ